MIKLRNINVELGFRLIMVGNESLGTCDNVSIRVDEATQEEVEKLKSSYQIRLVKVPKVVTWKCHICGEERPDDKIWVVTKPLIINGEVVGEQNIRYCNDRRGCILGAKTFSFFKEEK